MANDPATDDLEISNSDSFEDGIKDKNVILDISTALETILSEEHFDQKTIISQINEIGLIEIDVLQAHFLKVFKYEFPSLKALKDSKQEHAVSVDGKGREQIVEIFKSLQTQIITSDVPKQSFGSRLFGR